MILNGSGGGINEPRAALYASHGYLAFALAYFKAPSLSDYISNTPLEYFKQGLDWLRREYQPYKDFVALNGQSRGGELVLLLASLFPEDVSAVVAYVPSALVHSGQNAADHALGEEFSDALSQLRVNSAETPTAIMCSEAVWWWCHRRIIADYLLARGRRVLHIMGLGRLVAAQRSAGAVVGEDGKLLYPGQHA